MLLNPPQLVKYDPRLSNNFFDDFTSVVDMNSVTPDKVSAYFSGHVIGANSSILGGLDVNQLITGKCLLNHGTVVGDCAIVYVGNRVNISQEFGVMDLEFRVFLPVLSGAVDQFSFVLGVYDSPDNVYANGWGFLYNSAVSLNWQCLNRFAGVSTFVDTGIPININNSYRLRMIRKGSDGAIFEPVRYFVNDREIITAPTFGIGSQAQVLIIAGLTKQIGAQQRQVQIDYVNFQHNFNVAR